MGLLTGGEEIQSIYLKDNYTGDVRRVAVEEKAPAVITMVKKDKRVKSWFLTHELMKPCYGVSGIPDGTLALLICSRDVVFDPLCQLDDSWRKEKLSAKTKEMAQEQLHNAEGGPSSSMTMSMLFISISALILVIAIAFIGLMKYYRG